MTKVALCLSGKIGNTKGKSGYHHSEYKVLKKGYDHYKKHLIDINDVDVFIHCWDRELEKETNDIYKPVSSIFEEQIYFDIPPYVKSGNDNGLRANNHYSRWYSNKIVNEMKTEYEKKMGFKYDYVMTTRFDLAFEVDVIFSSLNSESVYAGKWSAVVDKHGKDYFKGGRGPLYDMANNNHPALGSLSRITKGYPKNDEGFLDLWFITNSKNSNSLFSLYDHLNDYNKPGNCQLDSSGRISNHRLVKHHMQKVGLLDKVEFKYHMYDDFPEVRRKYFGCRK
tara:strand:+ start:114 stop:956 length:843 start_codon:yes stop_codon:yes gene_type:complete